MSEGRDLTDELLDEETQGPSPGWKVTLEEPQGRDLTPELTPDPAQAPQAPAPPPPLRGPLSDLPWPVKTLAASGISAVAGWGGGALGGAVGSALPIVGTAAGATTGYLAGNAGARWLNVNLGLEEPGLVGDVLSIGLPALIKGGGAAIKALTPKAPGAGVLRHEMAEEMVEGLGTRLKPAMASDDLFKLAAPHNPTIFATSIFHYGDDLLKQENVFKTEMPKVFNATVAEIAQEAKDLVLRHHGQVPLHLMDDIRRRLGLLVQESSANNWVQTGGLKKLYGGFLDDMERAAAAGVPGAVPLRQAIKAHRMEKALDDLTDIWGPGKGIQQVEGGVTYVKGRQIQNGFERLFKEDAQFAKSFTPDEVLDIRKTLAVVGKYAPDVPTSTGRVGEALRRGTQIVGLGAGYYTSNPWLAGGVYVASEAVPYYMAMAMKTASGRWAIRTAMQDGAGILTNERVAFIAAAARAGLATMEPQQPRPGPFGGPEMLRPATLGASGEESRAAPGGPARSTD